MSCPEEFELFELREGGLPEDREREVADHVASCQECQAKLAELEALGQALAAPEPLTEADKANFVAQVVKRVEAEDPLGAAPVRRSPWIYAIPIAAAASCAALALLVVPTFFFVRDVGGEAPSVAYEPSAHMDRLMSSESVEESPAPVAAATPSAPPSAQPTGSAGGSGRANSLQGLRSRVARMEAESAPAKAEARWGRDSTSTSSEEADREARRRPRPAASKMHHQSDEDQVAGGSLEKRGGYAPPVDMTPYMRGPAAPEPTALDPNGRFATTYRPGRGHLARFESTMLKGRAPDAALALVSDVGRGSGPAVPAPTEKALALQIAPEMGELPPAGGPVHVAITLRSNERAPESRPTVAVHLVMDTSGSMSGQAIEQARTAAERLVELLEPGDRFSLVSYNSGASLVVTEGPVGPRRASILGQISQIRAGGGTNLSSGLQMGYGQATASRSVRDSVQLVIVLSDGRANQGITEPSALSDMAAAAFQGGIETTSIGVGDDYDPMVMSTLAEYGAGGYYYLPDASTIDQVLRAELEVRSRPVARAVELRVRLGEGVELLQAYGSRRLTQLEASRVRAAEVAIDHQTAHRDGIATDRQEDREGGMRFFIPGFARNDQHTILLRLRVPSGATGSQLRLADVELRYKDRILRQNGGDERSVRVPYAASQSAALGSQDRQVRRAVLSFRTGEALAQISTHLASGQQPQALALLHERSQLLSAASSELRDGALRAEAERLDAFRSMLASQGIGNRLMLGAIVRRASSGLMR